MLLVIADVAFVVIGSIVVGALAPRWPRRWLSTDRFPLTLAPWETAAFFRTLGTPWLARRLPELGGVFGGESKAALPGLSVDSLVNYLVEVRRAEWVHWWSIALTVVLFAVNPWWLALIFVVGVTLGNLPFILVLRNNRRRLSAIIARSTQT